MIARNNALSALFDDFAGTTHEWGANFVISTGIENIIGGSGNNIVKFHGTGRLDGFVDSNPAGKIALDYSDYSPAADYEADYVVGGASYNGVRVDGSAGIQASYGVFGPIPVFGDFPGFGVENGRAAGVVGSRLAGVDLLLGPDAFGDLSPTNNAVNGMLEVIGTPQRDYLKGNSKDNVFVIGHGGNDYVDGHGGKNNTVSLAGATQSTVVDLNSNTASTATIVPGSVNYSVASPPTLVVSGNAGSFTLTHEDNTTEDIPHDATATQIDAALEALASINTDAITVTAVAGQAGQFNINFGSVADTDLGHSAAKLFNQTDGTVAYRSAVNKLAVSGNAGSFTLTHAGNPATISAPVDAGAIQTALRELNGLGSVTVDRDFNIDFGEVADTRLTVAAAGFFSDT
ncbi:MAG: hypothetical protein VX257_01430, partial [Planctomycetota bacterium]|nr:hypothetical protein [Planctomycetota bacterium]